VRKLARRVAAASIRHLATALFLNHDRRRVYLAVFSKFVGYFDASGKATDPLVLYVSGFVSTEAKWLRFEREWGALLKRYDLTDFHTTNYVRGLDPEYARFKNNDAERDAFEAEAIRTIKRNTLKPFSNGIVLDAHRQLLSQYVVPSGYERPYSFCATMAFYSVMVWFSKQPRKKRATPDARIRMIFEDGEDSADWNPFSDTVYQEFGRRPVPQPKEDSPAQFQAADLLAWRHARLMKDSMSVDAGGPRPRREFFAGLFRQLPHSNSCGYHTPESLMRHAAKMGYPRRA